MHQKQLSKDLNVSEAIAILLRNHHSPLVLCKSEKLPDNNFWVTRLLYHSSMLSSIYPSIHFQCICCLLSQHLAKKSWAVVMAVIYMSMYGMYKSFFFDSYPHCPFYCSIVVYLVFLIVCMHDSLSVSINIYAHAHRKQWASQFKCLP